MLTHIQQLEKRTNDGRTEYIKNILIKEGVQFRIQPFRYRLLKGENLIVDHFCLTRLTYLLSW